MPEEEQRGPFYCDEEGCPKQSHPYTRREKLNDHIRSQHTGHRLKCPEPDCGQWIVRMGDLKKHMRTVHEGEKRYICACGARFTKKSSLNRHRYRTCEIVKDRPIQLPASDILLRPAAEIKKDPQLWDFFLQVAESTIRPRPFLGDGSIDGLLALHAADAVDVQQEVEQVAPFAFDKYVPGQVGSLDEIETDLYLELVNIFRRYRAITCDLLLEKIKVAVWNAHVRIIVNNIDADLLMPQVCLVLTSRSRELLSRKSTLDVSLGRIHGIPLYSVSLSYGDTNRLMGLFEWWSGIVPTPEAVLHELRAKQTAVVRWAAEILLSQEAWGLSASAQTLYHLKPARTLREADLAADCSKTVASGHTNSTQESVIPTISHMGSSTPSRDRIPAAAVYSNVGVDELPNRLDKNPLIVARRSHILVECPVCQRGFHNPSDYKRHMISHERPFKCSDVGCSMSVKGFASSNDCRQHEKVKHNLHENDRRWKCVAEDCITEDTTWSDLDAFEAHIRNDHPKVDVASQVSLSRQQPDYLRASQEAAEDEEAYIRQEVFADASNAAACYDFTNAPTSNSGS